MDDRRALLYNAQLMESNVSLPVPYIESVEFDSPGIGPLYLTVRDATDGTHYIDVSNSSRIAIADRLGNSMVIDSSGIYYSTNSCTYDVSIVIGNMTQQLAGFSGVACSMGSSPQRRMEDVSFQQTLYLRDQCNKTVTRSISQYPELWVGDTLCHDTAVDESTGRWDFDCTFPGSNSGTLECQSAVQNSILNFLFAEPFGGACPDVSTMITTLQATAGQLMSPSSLQGGLYNLGLDSDQQTAADASIQSYTQLWDILQQALSRTSSSYNQSALQQYISVYNQHRNFADDLCEDLHSGDLPLKLSLSAGVTYINAITTLNWAPQSSQPFNITVQDPSQKACCSQGYAAASATGRTGPTCGYPSSAVISNTGCVCGLTKGSPGMAYEVVECDNYVSVCKTDGDCAKAGYGSYLCLTGSCCGGGVCVDPYACSQNGTVLVTWEELDRSKGRD